MKTTVKFLCLILALLTLTACAGPASSVSLYEQGISLIATLDALAGNEDCVSLYSASPEIAAVIADAAQGSRSTPKTVYAITVPAGTAEIPTGISEDLRAFLTSRTFAALIPQVNGNAGVTALAAASICTVSKTFAAEGVTDVIYLYTYENALPVAVTFTAGEDGTVSGSATYLLDTNFPTDSTEAIQRFFTDLAVGVVEVSK